MSQPHMHDSLLVTNIDENCTDIEDYVVEQSVVVPPQPGEVNPMNIPQHRTERIVGSFDHSQYFEVRLGSQPFRIEPGQTRALPRYIAEHYAKHLADHILMKMEDKERAEALKAGRQPKTGFLQSPERLKILEKILKVEHWVNGDGLVQPEMPQQPDYPSAGTTDLGRVPNYAIGDIKEQPKTAEEILGTDANADKEVALTNSAKIKKERAKLTKEAVQLGIEVTGKESPEELKAKIATFVA